MSRAHTGPMAETARANVMKLAKGMLDGCKGQPKTDVCNAALQVGVTMAVMGGATEDMVVAVVKELCEKLGADRSN